MLPLYIELQKSADWQLTQRTKQFDISELLTSRSVRYAMCSVDRAIKNIDFDVALPIGEVVHGPCNLAYFTGDRLDELKIALGDRISQLQEIFDKANLSRTVDVRESARYIAEAVQNLNSPVLKQVPFVRFEGGCGLFASLARVMYQLLFGPVAYDTNQVMQGSLVKFAAVSDKSLQFKQGNDALLKRSGYRQVIDLIELWCNLTGLPFVSSIIQRCDKVSSSQQRNQMLTIAELAQAKMRVEPAVYMPDIVPQNSLGQTIDLNLLWKQVSYRLNSEDFKSLLLFLNLAMPMLQSQPAKENAFRIKLLRWQERNPQICN